MKQNTIDDFLNNKETYDGEVGKVKSGPEEDFVFIGGRRNRKFILVLFVVLS